MPFVQRVSSVVSPLTITQFTSKNVYTAWLKRLPFERGMYVVPAKCPIPRQQADYFMVVQMQEIHFLVQYDKVTGQPLAMEILNQRGERHWVYPLSFEVVIAPYTKEWLLTNVNP